MRALYVVVVLVACLAAGRVAAHHAFAAEFDIDKPITLEGTVREWEMINPHSWFHIDVENDDGEIVTWMIEGGSPNQLIRMGVTKRSVPVGTRLKMPAGVARVQQVAAADTSRTSRPQRAVPQGTLSRARGKVR